MGMNWTPIAFREGNPHRAVWRASPRHARTALAKGELDLTNIYL
jgi:hypothetical protein